MAVVVGEGDVTGRTGGEAEEDEHHRPGPQQGVNVQRPLVHLGQGEGLEPVPCFDEPGVVGLRHQGLALVDVDLKDGRIPGAHPFGVQIGQKLAEGFSRRRHEFAPIWFG